MLRQDTQTRKNSPKNTDPPSEWKPGVWDIFSEKLSKNRNSNEKPYYTVVKPLPAIAELPFAISTARPCANPTGSNSITIVFEREEYQRPLHRIRHLLEVRKNSGHVLGKYEQSSHICMDAINTDGKGTKHCTEPSHMIVEDDKTNKARQRCAGWIWIHTFEGHAGGYWYPTCTHMPACLRYTPKENIPTQIAQA
jgi:hypothetical protein